MASKFLLLLLPALAVAKINIEIGGTMTGRESDLKVKATGSDESVISDQEVRTFGLTDDNLKEGVKLYYGAWPSDAYLRSPTPWGDLYQSYNWPQVTRRLRPVEAKVLSIVSQPQILLEQIFENNSTKPATFNVGISQTVVNSIGQTWTHGGELSVGQEITYEIEIGAASVGGSTSFSYSSSWGNTKDERTDVTVGSSSSMELELAPGQSVKAILHATRGMALVKVDYVAELTGKVALNYDTPYKGHHFWGLAVEEVMKAKNLENKVMTSETIKIGFYSDAMISVNDRQKGIQMLKKKL